MTAWLNQNVELLSLVVSTGMFLIWVLYLQLFYWSYQLQRRPNLFIHQAAGFGLDSMCMIANMSESNVHVAAIIVDAEREGEAISYLPAPHSPDPMRAEDPTSQVHQGPLPQGGYFIIGQFRSLVGESLRRLPEGDGTLRLTVRLVAFVGSQLRPAGALRTFEVKYEGGSLAVRPVSIMPDQYAARRRRHVVQGWLEEARGMDRRDVASYQEDEESVKRLMDRLSDRTGPD